MSYMVVATLGLHAQIGYSCLWLLFGGLGCSSALFSEGIGHGQDWSKPEDSGLLAFWVPEMANKNTSGVWLYF